MKRALWILLALVAAALLVGWLLLRGGAGLPEVRDSAAPPPERVARGSYLARVGNCMLCHTERGGAAYAGGRALETPFGTIYASNLTPDPDTGIGRWSREAFRRALHEGVSRDGRMLYPAFPYTHTTRVTQTDADAIHDYLRSLPAVKQANRPHQLRWPFNTQVALGAWRALYFRPGQHVDEASRSAEWNRGAYLVRGLAHCGACHTARNALGGSADLMDLSGGLIPMQNWYAPSLASPSEASVATWPLAEIQQLLATGIAPRGSTMGPMAEVVLHSLQHLDPADIRAMAVFLKTLEPSETDSDPREVPRAGSAVMERGARIYGERCASCHGDRGEGVPNAYPPLAGNRAVTLPVTANLVQVVLHGGYPPATRGNPRPFGMPPFATILSDAEVSAVLTFVRASWNNGAAPLTELDVTRQRSSSR